MKKFRTGDCVVGVDGSGRVAYVDGLGETMIVNFFPKEERSAVVDRRDYVTEGEMRSMISMANDDEFTGVSDWIYMALSDMREFEDEALDYPVVGREEAAAYWIVNRLANPMAAGSGEFLEKIINKREERKAKMEAKNGNNTALE